MPDAPENRCISIYTNFAAGLRARLSGIVTSNDRVTSFTGKGCTALHAVEQAKLLRQYQASVLDANNAKAKTRSKRLTVLRI